VLRGEIMSLIESLSEQLERKHIRHVHRFDGFTLQIDGRIGKL
jgi:hypothetical protein